MSASNVVPLRGKPARTRQSEPPLRKAIGQALRRERTAQKRTLTDVAERAGISMQYLSEAERGRKEASSEILSAVCTSLGIRLLDLVAQTHRVLAVESRPVPTSAPRGPMLMAV
jgi:DNA-binding Xre family transcriptional regulator